MATFQGNSYGLPRSPWWGTKGNNQQSIYGWTQQDKAAQKSKPQYAASSAATGPMPEYVDRFKAGQPILMPEGERYRKAQEMYGSAPSAQSMQDARIRQGASPYDNMSPMDREASRLESAYGIQRDAANRASDSVGRTGRVISGNMTAEDRQKSMPNASSDLGARGTIVGGPYGASDAGFFAGSADRLRAQREAASEKLDSQYQDFERSREATNQEMASRGIENPEEMKQNLDRLTAQYRTYKTRGGDMKVRDWYREAYDRGMIDNDMKLQIEKNYGNIFEDKQRGQFDPPASSENAIRSPQAASDWDEVAQSTYNPTRESLARKAAAQQSNLQRRREQEAAQAQAAQNAMQMRMFYNMEPEVQAAYMNRQADNARAFYGMQNENMQRGYDRQAMIDSENMKDQRLRDERAYDAEQRSVQAWDAAKADTMLGTNNERRRRAQLHQISKTMTQGLPEEAKQYRDDPQAGMDARFYSETTGDESPSEAMRKLKEINPEATAKDLVDLEPKYKIRSGAEALDAIDKLGEERKKYIEAARNRNEDDMEGNYPMQRAKRAEEEWDRMNRDYLEYLFSIAGDEQKEMFSKKYNVSGGRDKSWFDVFRSGAFQGDAVSPM